MGRARHQKKRSTKEKHAFAVMLGGEYIPYANLIQVTEATKPTVWYCATRMVELPEIRARERLMHSRHKSRRGKGGWDGHEPR